MAKLKILLIMPTFNRSGVPRVASVLGNEWSKQHEVITAIFDSSEIAYETESRIVDIYCPARPGFLNKVRNTVIRIYRIWYLIRKEKPDQIIAFMESANIPTILACKFSGNLGRLVVSVHTNPARILMYQQYLIKLLYNWAAVVVAVSTGVQEFLVANFGLKRCINIPNPIDRELILSALCYNPTSSITKTEKFILAAGSLRHEKGFDLLISAFAQIAADISETLVIIGEGVDRIYLQKLIASFNLDGRIILAGNVSNPFAYMYRARLFVMSSRWESWGNVLMEAMACSCAVVSFDCDYGPREIISHKQSGLLVNANKINDLGANIKRLLHDDAKRIELGLSGLEASRKWDVVKIAPLWLTAIDA